MEERWSEPTDGGRDRGGLGRSRLSRAGGRRSAENWEHSGWWHRSAILTLGFGRIELWLELMSEVLWTNFRWSRTNMRNIQHRMKMQFKIQMQEHLLFQPYWKEILDIFSTKQDTGYGRRVPNSPFCSTRPPPPRIWDMELLFDARIVPLLSSTLPLMPRWVSWTLVVLILIPRYLLGKFETGAITKRLLCPRSLDRSANEGSIRRSKASVLMQGLTEPTETVLSNKSFLWQRLKLYCYCNVAKSWWKGPKMNRIFPSFNVSRRKPLGQRPPFALYLHKSLTTGNGGTEPLGGLGHRIRGWRDI